MQIDLNNVVICAEEEGNDHCTIISKDIMYRFDIIIEGCEWKYIEEVALSINNLDDIKRAKLIELLKIHRTPINIENVHEYCLTFDNKRKHLIMKISTQQVIIRESERKINDLQKRISLSKQNVASLQSQLKNTPTGTSYMYI